MSLYRQYRPQTFADVAGQESVVGTLQSAVAQGKVAHAYLFAGPRGTGKTSLARILAKEILTRGIEDDVLKKQILRGVEEGSLVDLIEIDAASNRGIDDIRSLVEKIQFSPVAAGAKVYIIDEVHMLTREAFNALLKTLEEPPSYAFFILATTELQKIPATIQSRCQRFVFRQITDLDIVKRLRFIADQEGISVEDNALQAIAHHAQGGLRDAISLLDQLRSLPEITLADVQARTGESGIENVEEILTAIRQANRPAIVETVRRIEEAGTALDAFVRQLLSALRTELHRRVAQNEPITEISKSVAALLDAIRDMRTAPIPGLVLEATLLSLAGTDLPGNIAAAESATSIKPPTVAPPMPPKQVPSASMPIAAPIKAEPAMSKPVEPSAPSSATEQGELTLAALRKAWPDIVNKVSPASVKMSLKNAHVTGLDGSHVVLSFQSAFHRDRVAQTDAATGVEHLLQETFHLPLKLECLIEQDQMKPTPKQDMVDLAEAAADVF